MKSVDNNIRFSIKTGLKEFKMLITWIMVIATIAAITITGCGGGSGGGSTGSASGSGISGNGGGGGGGTGTATPSFASGIMTKGSVIVNGIRFSTTGASIIIDDNPGNETELEDGMNVKVKGTVNDDGVTGQASEVEAGVEIKGLVESIDTVSFPPSLVVLKQTIIVDDTTIFVNVANLAATPIGSMVEIHGRRDANGMLRASRIEGVGAENEVEVTGIVSNKQASTFQIGALVINAANATFFPAGTTLASIKDGDIVEVKGTLNQATGQVDATRIELEDEPKLNEGEKFRVEGFVSGFTAHPGTFMVGSTTVQTTSATIFKRGSSLDLMNNVEVEAEGKMVNGVLVADEIEFEQARIRLQGTVSSVSANSFAILGLTVYIAKDITRIDNPLVDGGRFEIEAIKDKNGKLIAERIKETGDTRDILQGMVESKDEAAKKIVILGITIDLSQGAEFRDANDNAITAAEFFAKITTGSVVKARGTFTAPNSFAADQVEFEND